MASYIAVDLEQLESALKKLPKLPFILLYLARCGSILGDKAAMTEYSKTGLI